MNITLPRAVVEQAIEALEYAVKNWHGHGDNFVWLEAITALRAALEQDKKFTSFDAWYKSIYPTILSEEAYDAAQRAFAAALDAAKGAEPVAWMWEWNDNGVYEFSESEPDEPGAIPLYPHPAPAVPPDWQLVPKEPTLEQRDEMREAAHQYIVKHGRYDNGMLDGVYKVMLAAAPKEPT